MVESTYGGLLKSNSIFETSFIIFIVAVVPAICEETFFRGFIQKSFEQKFKPIYSAVITAVFFGLYHFNPYGLIPLIALGIYFGFAAYTTESILVPMILHFTNNFIAILAFFIWGSDELIASKKLGSDEIMSNTISMIILLIIFSIFIYLLLKNYRTNSRPNTGGNHDMP
jgi:membrane protease YdiL (CAAX protease family)